ncbi:MAG: transketolase family protein [Candidatus Kapabacteria bacterium]|nr:transketolase family protein [Ignavibacteriota bacterium]MCW5883872.1 transketolase family protein [Candidatus Kapabacteria bacterium]
MKNLEHSGLKPTRAGFGKALVEMGEKHSNLVVIGADVTGSVLTSYFQEKFPERFISVGVAEQNATTVAAGLALSGKIAVFSSYSAFSAFRNADMLRVSVAYNDVNVKIGGGHSGVTVGPDGATHQSLEEIAFLRALPNMTVVVPADYEETRKATIAVIEKPGPAFIRFGRPAVPAFTDENSTFEIGKANILREGNDLAIVACGHLVWQALLAAEELSSKHGIEARVINNHTIKPIDLETITDAAMQCKAIVTAEEHQVHGGLGGAVAEVVVKNYPSPIELLGMRDTFGGSGEPEELLEKYGLTYKEIVLSSLKVIERKEKGFIGYRKVSDVPIAE